MGELLRAFFVPHPPIMIPEIGGEEVHKVRDTVSALKKIAEIIKNSHTDTLIVITPHGAVFSDGLAVTSSRRLQGDFGRFGAPRVKFKFENDQGLCRLIIKKAALQGINTLPLDKDTAAEYNVTVSLDQGIMAPLYYLTENLKDIKLLPIAMGMLPFLDLYRFGMAVTAAIEESASSVVLVASGDLSHRLQTGAPAGYHPRGKDFDKEIYRGIAEFDWQKLLSMPGDLLEDAGECGFRPLCILLGALDGFQVKTEVLSYEGPFGVGYLTADFLPTARDNRCSRLELLNKSRREMLEERRQQETAPVRLARKTLESFIRKEKLKGLNIDEIARQRAGAFVSIKKEGQLRGCIGTIEPTCRNLAEEIMQNAISAGTRDPRFPPVSEEELPFLTYSVDVLRPAEKIADINKLDPRRYGVIVRNGSRSGLLLPDLEGIESAEEQVAIAKQKAGIAADEPVELERFEVERFH